MPHRIIAFYLLACLLPMPVRAQGINAAADAQPALRSTLPVPVETEPAAASLDRSHGQDWHRVSARLAGSMCPACLMDLEKKLRQAGGVAFAKISRQSAPAAPAAKESTRRSRANHATAEAVIVYDSKAITLDGLRLAFKQEKYKPQDLHDEPLPANP
jgi:hypothetical protein